MNYHKHLPSLALYLTLQQKPLTVHLEVDDLRQPRANAVAGLAQVVSLRLLRHRPHQQCAVPPRATQRHTHAHAQVHAAVHALAGTCRRVRFMSLFCCISWTLCLSFRAFIRKGFYNRYSVVFCFKRGIIFSLVYVLVYLFVLSAAATKWKCEQGGCSFTSTSFAIQCCSCKVSTQINAKCILHLFKSESWELPRAFNNISFIISPLNTAFIYSWFLPLFSYITINGMEETTMADISQVCHHHTNSIPALKLRPTTFTTAPFPVSCEPAQTPRRRILSKSEWP